MKPKKTKSLPKAKAGTASTYKEAHSMTGYPEAWVRLACQSGGARTRGGRIDIAKVKAWVESNAEKLEQSSQDLPLKEQKLAEEVRKLRIRNDRDAGKLVELAWINERFQRFGGELHAIRSKSESEHPVNFGAAAGDVAACRSVLRGIWDDIMKAMQACSKHFEK